MIVRPSTQEAIEGQKNRRVRESKLLLEKIIDEIGLADFNANDVRESFNPMTAREGEVRIMRFGISHLNYLVKIGALEYLPEKKIYRLNPSSRHVALEYGFSHTDDYSG